MMKASHVLALTAIFALSSCDQVKEAAGKKIDAELARAKEQVKEDVKAAIEDNELVRSGKEYAEKAKATLARLDVTKLKSDLEQMQTAIAAGDFSSAERLGKSVDGFLGNGTVGNTVELMKVRAQQGKDAAQRKLEELKSLSGLEPEQKALLEKIGTRISSFDSKDRESVTGLLFLAVYLGCESQVGHSGDIALALVDQLFPGGQAAELLKEMKVESGK